MPRRRTFTDEQRTAAALALKVHREAEEAAALAVAARHRRQDVLRMARDAGLGTRLLARLLGVERHLIRYETARSIERDDTA